MVCLYGSLGTNYYLFQRCKDAHILKDLKIWWKVDMQTNSIFKLLYIVTTCKFSHKFSLIIIFMKMRLTFLFTI